MMRIVVAVNEHPVEDALGRLPRLTPLQGAEALLVHVLDTGGREEWERGAARRLFRPGGPARQGDERMHAADRAGGERALARAAAIAASSWPDTRVETRLLQGSPKHEIRRLLDDEGADLLVVFVHGYEVGPKSIGKEARFLIDHAPCPVLVVKLVVSRES